MDIKRESGKQVISSILFGDIKDKYHEQVIDIENFIYNSQHDRDYLEKLYNVLPSIYNYTFESNLMEDKLFFKSDIFSKYRQLQEESDSFSENPIEVQEGVHICKRCKSNRTISFEAQTRSADEAMTVFAQCVKCNFRWKS